MNSKLIRETASFRDVFKKHGYAGTHYMEKRAEEWRCSRFMRAMRRDILPYNSHIKEDVVKNLNHGS